MSLQTRIGDLVLAVGTDIKQLRTWATGSSTGDLTGLTTTAKTSLLAAVNEVNAKVPPAPAAASETVFGIAEIATQTETNAGTDDSRFVTPMKFQTRLAAYAQPLSANLTNLAGAASTAYGRALLNLADQNALMGLMRAATELVSGDARLATQAETDAGTLDTVVVTPLKFQTRLAAYAQAKSANLTTLAGIVSGVTGQTLLQAATPAAAKTTLGLATVATSGSASDITTGTLPASVLPAISISDTFVVTSQAAMLALTAQRGDVAKRTDLNGQAFILSTDSPATLADWISLSTTSDVSSVNGQTGAVTITKTDVGLANVDNTSDVNKPISTAQAAANALNLKIANNLSDLQSAATARTNLSVYSQAEVGNPETDLVAAYNTAKA